MISSKENKNNISLLVILFIIANVLIPKAGIKVSGIPLTLGNLLLFCLLLRHVFFTLKGKRFRFDKTSKYIAIGIAYWLVVLLFGMLTRQGNAPYRMYSTGDSVSYLISLVIYPLIFFVLKKEIDDYKKIELLIRIMFVCFFIALVYAIVQYIFGIRKVTVPGLTVNLTDYLKSPTGWWRSKYNRVSSSSDKIFSTYQNGNIWGANLILILPITLALPQKNVVIKYVMLALSGFVVFVSGCRTAFFGFLLYVFLLIIQMLIKRRTRWKTIFYGFGFLVVVVIIVAAILRRRSDYLNRILKALNWNTMMRATGRTSAFFEYVAWLFREGSIKAFLFGNFCKYHEGWAYEMVAGCVFIIGGLFGEIAFLMPWATCIGKLKKVIRNPLAIGFMNSLIVYFFVSFIDGAFWLLPTGINYWTILSLGYLLALYAPSKGKTVIANENSSLNGVDNTWTN